MLFLLNNFIVSVDAPEHHLGKFWKRLGCGEPTSLSAEQAIQFATMVVEEHAADSLELSTEVKTDLAALIISKTGANAALFGGHNSAKLNILSEEILVRMQNILNGGGEKSLKDYWTAAA